MKLTIDKFPEGIIDIIPSKSMAHRAIICAGLADGVSVIKNIPNSKDVTATINCIRSLNADVKKVGNDLHITGGISSSGNPLDCGESGSTLRFLIPVCSLLEGEKKLVGHGRLMERPLFPLTDELDKNGTKTILENNELTLSGKLSPGDFYIKGDVSSQFISGLLFALPTLCDDSTINITSKLQSKPYVDMTIDVINKFGVNIINESYERFIIKGNQRYLPSAYTVEGDYSQAAFFLVAGVLGCKCECRGLHFDSLQGDRRILDIIRECGGEIHETSNGTIFTKINGVLKPLTIDVSDIPDLVPPLAVLLSFCNGTSKLVNAGRLRLKESDRLNTVSEELNKIGADITVYEDGMIINGVASFAGGEADGRNDHRIPMMLSVAALKAKKPVIINGYECVEKSYPNFFEVFMITEAK